MLNNVIWGQYKHKIKLFVLCKEYEMDYLKMSTRFCIYLLLVTHCWSIKQKGKIHTKKKKGKRKSSELTLVTRRTVVYTGWSLLETDCNVPSWYTEERGMSLPVESSKPSATGMNMGSFTGCPGVGGTSWLWKAHNQTQLVSHITNQWERP